LAEVSRRHRRTFEETGRLVNKPQTGSSHVSHLKRCVRGSDEHETHEEAQSTLRYLPQNPVNAIQYGEEHVSDNRTIFAVIHVLRYQDFRFFETAPRRIRFDA
jgi:hypothetical protein